MQLQNKTHLHVESLSGKISSEANVFPELIGKFLYTEEFLQTYHLSNQTK